MSRCRTRRRRSNYRSRTSERVRSARPMRFGLMMTGCARPIPTSRVSSPISTPRRRAGIVASTSAVVLGAGGGARAVIFALLAREVGRIYVINRTRASAPRPCRKQFGARVQVAGWEETTGLLGGAGLLVNTTTLGMVGQPPLEINLRCPASLVVADLVYAPLVTGCWRPRAHAGCAPPTVSACCCTRRCADSSCGSAYAPR